MSASNSISLKLSFNQVWETVKQLPEDQQKKLVTLITKNTVEPAATKLSEKEKSFLQGIDESVDYVNNYKPSGKKGSSLKQFLDEL